MKWMTRKDVATLLEVSVASVRKGEVRLGLKAFKRSLNARRVEYDRVKVEKHFHEMGWT